ncbi:MAG TPA: hypothetical protein VHA55_01315 [Pseudorhodoplanes sp.]|nr:hypothetical protein [Pseudorhodoplanes sp.]
MLPDLRVLLVATISTFLVAIGTAFFLSVHLAPDQFTAQPDRSTPINRVSTSWQDVSRPATPALGPMVATRPREIEPPQAKGPVEAAGETIAVKTPASTAYDGEEKDASQSPANEAQPKEADAPDSTGSIAPPSETSPTETPTLSAHPDAAATPAEPPAAISSAAKPKAKTAARPARRHRVVRQEFFDAQSAQSAANPNYNVFIDFGSRMR